MLPCDAASGEDACAAKFIADFGKRAYRRPLSDVETMRLTALYQNARTVQKMTFNDAIETLLEGILQSPAFLYHWESPYEAPKLDGAVVQLSAYDVASRLSYFIWGTMPDQALFDAAAAGKLTADADIAAQARRMLTDEKAKDAATAFFREWLEIDQIAPLPKDAKSVPRLQRRAEGRAGQRHGSVRPQRAVRRRGQARDAAQRRLHLQQSGAGQGLRQQRGRHDREQDHARHLAAVGPVDGAQLLDPDRLARRLEPGEARQGRVHQAVVRRLAAAAAQRAAGQAGHRRRHHARALRRALAERVRARLPRR